MHRFTVALIGRPNAGKSTLFNRLLKTYGKGTFMSAITDSTPGVTRDRNYGALLIQGRDIEIIDTGGFMPDSMSLDNRDINSQVREQAVIAMQEADLVIHLLDSKEGINHSDREMAHTIREMGKPCIYAANKIDSPEKEKNLFEFYELGVSEVVALSAMTGYNLDALIERIVAFVPASEEFDKKKPYGAAIAVVGRPNTGKSTLINTLIGKKRLIVSATPGTTRDAIDSIVKYYNQQYLFVDTAGIRKRSKASEIEQFSMVRAVKAIERCDIALLLIDATAGVTDQDQKIAGILRDAGKGVVIAVNKWDLIDNPDEAYNDMEREVRKKLWFIDYAPIVTLSGVTKKRITRLFPIVDKILVEFSKRISTSELNDLLIQNREALKGIEETSKGLKILYMTQVSVAPPHFVLFINRMSSLKKHHMRFFEGIIRAKYAFYGVPIRISVKARREGREVKQ